MKVVVAVVVTVTILVMMIQMAMIGWRNSIKRKNIHTGYTRNCGTMIQGR
jgi:hypothetical protein